MKTYLKPYTWVEIEKVIREELRKTKHIMTVGTIGSCNINHDVDLIITKKPNSKSADFYKEIHNLFEGIDSYLKKRYKARAITTRKFVQEVEVCALAKRHPKDLILHVMTYIFYSQMKMHWFDEFIKGENIRGILDKSYKDILGSKDSIFSKEFSTTGNYEAMFCYMNDSDRINSNYEEPLLCEVMNNLFEYILKKRLNLKPRTASNRKEVKKVFYYICEELDKLNTKRIRKH